MYHVVSSGISSGQYFMFEQARDRLTGILFSKAASCSSGEAYAGCRQQYRDMAQDVQHWLSPQGCWVGSSHFQITDGAIEDANI